MIMLIPKHRLPYPTGIPCLSKGAESGKKPIRTPSEKEFSNSDHYCFDNDLAVSGSNKLRVNSKLHEV